VTYGLLEEMDENTPEPEARSGAFGIDAFTLDDRMRLFHFAAAEKRHEYLWLLRAFAGPALRTAGRAGVTGQDSDAIGHKVWARIHTPDHGSGRGLRLSARGAVDQLAQDVQVYVDGTANVHSRV
jgi:hypothetical protein